MCVYSSSNLQENEKIYAEKNVYCKKKMLRFKINHIMRIVRKEKKKKRK